MRWLTLLLLTSCTLITDPSSFEGSDDAGTPLDAMGDGDSTIDATADVVPLPDANIDAPPESCCAGGCAMALGAMFSPLTSILASREAVPGGAERQLILVPRIEVPPRIEMVRRTPDGYFVTPLDPAAPPGVSPPSVAAQEWLESQFPCLDRTFRSIADLDVYTYEGQLHAAVAELDLAPGFELHHLSRVGSCASTRIVDMAPRMTSAGSTVGVSVIARALNDAVVRSDGGSQDYPTVFATDGSGPVQVVTGTNASGNFIEFLVGGVGAGPESVVLLGDHRPALVPIPEEEAWYAVFAGASDLFVDRFDLPSDRVTALADIEGIATPEYFDVARLPDPRRDLLVVASLYSGGTVTLHLVDAAEQSVALIHMFSAGMIPRAIEVTSVPGPSGMPFVFVGVESGADGGQLFRTQACSVAAP